MKFKETLKIADSAWGQFMFFFLGAIEGAAFGLPLGAGIFYLFSYVGIIGEFETNILGILIFTFTIFGFFRSSCKHLFKFKSDTSTAIGQLVGILLPSIFWYLGYAN